MEGFGGVWGLNPQPPEARGLVAKPPVLGDFCNFSIKITHFGQNSYLKQ